MSKFVLVDTVEAEMFDGDIDKVLATVSQWKEQGIVQISVTQHYSDVDIELLRNETEQERDERIAIETKVQAKKHDQEYQRYLKLKAKFDSKA